MILFPFRIRFQTLNIYFLASSSRIFDEATSSNALASTSATTATTTESAGASVEALSKLRKRVSQLEGDHILAQQSIDTLTSSLDAERNNVTTLREQLTRSTQAAENHVNKIATLEAELASQKQVTARFPAVEEQVVGLQTKVHALESDDRDLNIQASVDSAVADMNRRMNEHIRMTDDLVQSHQTTIQVMRVEMDKMRQQRSAAPSPPAPSSSAAGPSQRSRSPVPPVTPATKRTYEEVSEDDSEASQGQQTCDDEDMSVDQPSEKRTRISLGESISSEEASIVDDSLQPLDDDTRDDDDEPPVSVKPAPAVSQLVPPAPAPALHPPALFSLFPPPVANALPVKPLPFALTPSPTKKAPSRLAAVSNAFATPASPAKNHTISLPTFYSPVAGPSTGATSPVKFTAPLPPASPSRGSPAKTSRANVRPTPMGKRPAAKTTWMSAKTPTKLPNLPFGFGLGLSTPGGGPLVTSTPNPAAKAADANANGDGNAADMSFGDSDTSMSLSFGTPGARRPSGFRAPSFEFGLTSASPRTSDDNEGHGASGSGSGSSSSSGAGFAPSSPAFPIQVEPHGPNPDQYYDPLDQARRMLKHDHGSSPSPPPVSPDKKRKYGSEPKAGEYEDAFDGQSSPSRRAAKYGLDNPGKW